MPSRLLRLYIEVLQTTITKYYVSKIVQYIPKTLILILFILDLYLSSKSFTKS